MSDSVKVHALWLLAAAGSLVIGMQFPGAAVGQKNDAGSAEAGESKPGAVGSPAGGRSQAPKSAEDRSADGVAKSPRRGLTESEVEEIGQQFRDTNDPIEKRLAFSKLLEGLTAENAELVREQIVHLGDKTPEYREFHYAWGAIAGEQAALFGIGTEGDDIMPALAGWASNNPSGATAWFQSLDITNDSRFDPLTKDREIPADGLRGHLMRGLVRGLADTDPEAAAAFVIAAAGEGDKSAYHGMMNMVVEARLRQQSPEEVAAWAAGIDNEHLRGQTLGSVADRFARTDLESATEWASSLGNEAGNAVAQVAGHYAHRNPAEALGWLAELPVGSAQQQGTRRAMGVWTGRDAGAASRYLVEMEPSPARDAAVSGFANRVVWQDPEAAVAWADTIANPEQREETLMRTGRAWLHRDRVAATQWLEQSGLSAGLRQQLLNPEDDQRER